MPNDAFDVGKDFHVLWDLLEKRYLEQLCQKGSSTDIQFCPYGACSGPTDRPDGCLPEACMHAFTSVTFCNFLE